MKINLRVYTGTEREPNTELAKKKTRIPLRNKLLKGFNISLVTNKRIWFWYSRTTN